MQTLQINKIFLSLFIIRTKYSVNSQQTFKVPISRTISIHVAFFPHWFQICPEQFQGALSHTRFFIRSLGLRVVYYMLKFQQPLLHNTCTYIRTKTDLSILIYVCWGECSWNPSVFVRQFFFFSYSINALHN